MQTPSELLTLAKLRARGQSPAMVVFVTDEWRWAERLADLGTLAIRVRAEEHHACDWSPIAGLSVMLCQWRTPASDTRLASALLAAKPMRLETYDARFNRLGSQVVWDRNGGDSISPRQRDRRDTLLAIHWRSP